MMTEPAEWAWIAPFLLALARTRGPGFAPHLVRVVGDFAAGGYGFEPWETYTLNHDRTSAMFGDRLGELLQYLAGVESSEWYVQSARAQAGEWLAERGGAS